MLLTNQENMSKCYINPVFFSQGLSIYDSMGRVGWGRGVEKYRPELRANVNA